MGLLGNDGVIKVHFEEWWGKEVLRAKRRRNGGVWGVTENNFTNPSCLAALANLSLYLTKVEGSQGKESH